MNIAIDRYEKDWQLMTYANKLGNKGTILKKELDATFSKSYVEPLNHLTIKPLKH